MSKKDGPRCTVGDDFTGFKKIVHDLMMQNELYNGYGAYKVSYADTKSKDNKSGLSFGANQMDMSKNSKAIQVFIKIMENATDSYGNLLVNPDILLDIRGGVNNPNLKKTLTTPEQVFGKNLSLVNAALKSLM